MCKENPTNGLKSFMNEQDLVSASKGRLESLFPSERELVSNVNIRVK